MTYKNIKIKQWKTKNYILSHNANKSRITIVFKEFNETSCQGASRLKPVLIFITAE